MRDPLSDMATVDRRNGWQQVCGSAFPAPATWRLAVPGGWLYYVLPDHREPSMAFVPEKVVVTGGGGGPIARRGD